MKETFRKMFVPTVQDESERLSNWWAKRIDCEAEDIASTFGISAQGNREMLAEAERLHHWGFMKLTTALVTMGAVTATVTNAISEEPKGLLTEDSSMHKDEFTACALFVSVVAGYLYKECRKIQNRIADKVEKRVNSFKPE